MEEYRRWSITNFGEIDAFALVHLRRDFPATRDDLGAREQEILRPTDVRDSHTATGK
jgi:hypothetical protein